MYIIHTYEFRVVSSWERGKEMLSFLNSVYRYYSARPAKFLYSRESVLRDS